MVERSSLQVGCGCNFSMNFVMESYTFERCCERQVILENVDVLEVFDVPERCGCMKKVNISFFF